MRARRVLIIAAGDGARSDGACSAAELLRRLRELPVAERWWLSLLGDSQFQIEHAMDLQISDLAIFVDTGDTGDSAFSFHRLQQPAGYRISTTNTSLTPADVMHTLATVGRRDELPDCYELRLDAGLAAGRDDAHTKGLQGALAFLEQLLDEPEPLHWQQLSED